MANVKKYTSATELQDYWVNNIAPNYFDMDNINNYRAGIFGYINEVMSNVTMDTHYAINVARREFYPVTAQNPQSIYKMSALQQLGLPVATAATCKAILLLNQDEIISNSTYKNGVYTCVIDNTAEILADSIPFVLDFPIIIISKRTNDKWTHTVHYDKSTTNDLAGTTNYYITNKVINQDGKRYLLVSVQLRQLTKESISQLVTTDSLIQTVSLLYSFEGDLANFEVYYVEEPEVSRPVQLTKLMQGQSMVEKPFCYYRLLNSNLLEISFPKNVYFTPDMNSEIRVDVYTSMGSSGNFDSFNGSLACTLDSELYPYNNNMSMTGIIDGVCTGGKDIPTLEKYTQLVQNAYSTNNVYTSTNDLQIKFDSLSDDENNRVKFRKKRADAMYREYGAYVLLKDENGNVVPTNTLTINMKLEDFDTYNETAQKAFIKPGTIFEYDPESNNSEIYTAKKCTDVELNDNLSAYDATNSRFLYTNPFLIAATLNPNVIGYYYNSVNTTRSVDYNYINDSSVIQFIGSNYKVYRNTIDGENFYKFSITVSPTNEIPIEEIIDIPTEDNDDDYFFRAEKNGMVESILYDEDAVICTIRYDDDETDTITVSCNVIEDEDGDYTYTSGYNLLVDVYDTFIEGDVLGIKKVTDHGKIRACLNFQGILYDNNLYIPLVIEEYNSELPSFTMCGYLSTDDIMDNGAVLIDHGICDTTGFEDDNVSLSYSGLKSEISVFYQNDDTNFTHKYSEYDYFKKHTLTNTYVDSDESTLELIQHIDFIKSVLTFSEGEGNTEDNEDDYIITIKEVPLAKANWIKSTSNFNYLTNAITTNYAKLKSIYYDLENNFEIDMKFYNTYGKSKFFRVGIKNSWAALEHVNCSFKFGIYLSSIVTKSTFLSQFRTYVKDKIESINKTAGTGQSIYIMSLIRDIQDNFSEIGYVEYYGFDEYDLNVQKIEPIPTSAMSTELLSNYIPEFINICTYLQNGENIPSIEVEFLDDIED